MLSGIAPLALSIVAVLAGSLAQRLTGIGFSLIVAPALVLAIGPRAGVAMTNLLTLQVAFAVFATSARRVDRARSALLVLAGLTGVLAGSVLAGMVPSRPLQVMVGAVTGLGLLAVAAARRLRFRPRRLVTWCAGLASGLTTAIAGAGGPALTVYAVATDWPQREFIAAGQLCFACQAAVALLIKGVPHVPALWFPCTGAAELAGLAAGGYLTKRTSGKRARQATIGLACLAALAAVAAGLR